MTTKLTINLIIIIIIILITMIKKTKRTMNKTIQRQRKKLMIATIKVQNHQFLFFLQMQKYLCFFLIDFQV